MEQAREQARAREVEDDAVTSLHDKLESVSLVLERPEVKEQLAWVRAHLEDLDRQVRKLVQERPLVAVGAALFCGYAIGRLLVRR
jgi:hypothetical protein